MSVGVPVKLLHEAETTIVTVEMKTGEVFRGYLREVEDTMNVRLDGANYVRRDGKQESILQVYLRGSHIRYIIVPDMFKNAPMFKRVRAQAKGKNNTNLRSLRTKSKQVRGKLFEMRNGLRNDV